MRYQRKSAIAYMFRNLPQLLLFGLAAAIPLGFFCNSNVEISFFYAYFDGSINSENIMTEIMNTFTVLRFRSEWWGVLIAFVAFVLAESILAVKVSRHMRTGEMQFLPLRRAVAVLPTMLLFVLCVLGLLEILNLIVAGIAFLCRQAGVIALIVITSVLWFLVRVLAMWAVGMLLFAFPIMFLENYSFNSALSYSVRLMSEKLRILWVAATAYPLAKFLLTVLCGVINNYWASVSLFTVFYLFAVLFVPCLTFRMYFDTVGGERRDLMRLMFD